MGITFMPALFTGAVLGSISPVVVIPIVRMFNLSELTKSKLVVESAITDVLSIIIALGILKTFQSGHKTIMEFIEYYFNFSTWIFQYLLIPADESTPENSSVKLNLNKIINIFHYDWTICLSLYFL